MPTIAEELTEGYRERVGIHARLAEVLTGVSVEANDSLGDAPEW